jgi:hypothetical protein
MRRGAVHTGFWWGNLRERDCLKDPNVDGRIILSWIFKKWNVGGMDWIELVQDTCECSNEPSGSIKCGEFLD